jgi:hypothetical protein
MSCSDENGTLNELHVGQLMSEGHSDDVNDE